MAGFLAPLGDVDAMADGVVELLASPERWQAASDAARDVAARYSTDRVVPRYEALYHRVLSS